MNYLKVLQFTSNVGYTNLVAISSVVVYDLAEIYASTVSLTLQNNSKLLAM